MIFISKTCEGDDSLKRQSISRHQSLFHPHLFGRMPDPVNPSTKPHTFTNKNGVVETKSIQQLNAAKRTKSTLAAHVWEVRDSGLSPNVEWSILLRSNAYQPGDHYCGICLGEVTLICFADPEESLNKRNELRQGCRHKTKFKLSNLNPP